MEIYRVTVENPFTDDVLQSHYFASQLAAVGYAEMLKDEIENDFSCRYDIVVAAYTPDDGGEFFFDHEVTSYEL